MTTETTEKTEHFDVLVIGAGLSGIGAGYYLQTRCPHKSYTILEGREAMGGTWDLFRYPGIRSDSDMYTLGFAFHPWTGTKAIADGPSIRQYLHDTAAEYGIDRQIRYGHRLQQARWSTADAQWTVEATRAADGATVYFTCNFLYMCTGYYDYNSGYTPEWPGIEQFGGQLIHPQKWPEDLDYKDKRIVVIGSGATAVTLVPAMSEQAAHVTMLQRSPSYIVSLPSNDPFAARLHRWLPNKLADGLSRWKAILQSIGFYKLSRWRPAMVKKMIRRMTSQALGPDYDLDTHFSPKYNPWDQRLCVIPDSDLFKAISSGRVDVVTDEIESFTETGINLRSGAKLAADIIVTATGLSMSLMHGVQLFVDEVPVDLSERMIYKGMMYSDIPNLASAIGYTTASWTLKCELISRYICRLLNYMDQHDYQQCTPHNHGPAMETLPAIDFSSGYIQRIIHTLPRQGSRRPWKLYQNYLSDLFTMQYAPITDGTLTFTHQPTNPESGSQPTLIATKGEHTW